jgi:hypothetical protein
MSAHSQILLTSSEGTEFLIDRDIADKSMLLKCMLEDIGEIGQGARSLFLSFSSSHCYFLLSSN